MAVPAMANPIANTTFAMATGTGNVREDFADIIYEIDPWELPMVAACGNQQAEQPMTEWLVQALDAAQDNAQPEGFRYTAMPIHQPQRLNNIAQIMVRAVTVSNTYRVSNTVGGDEFDRQTLLKGKELQRDLEYCVTRGTVKATPAAPAHAACRVSDVGHERKHGRRRGGTCGGRRRHCGAGRRYRARADARSRFGRRSSRPSPSAAIRILR